MPDVNRGVYKKFRVERTDGQSAPGEKHHDCEYFVLDTIHDPYARAALLAYAFACEERYPMLAADARRMASKERILGNDPSSLAPADSECPHA